MHKKLNINTFWVVSQHCETIIFVTKLPIISNLFKSKFRLKLGVALCNSKITNLKKAEVSQRCKTTSNVVLNLIIYIKTCIKTFFFAISQHCDTIFFHSISYNMQFVKIQSLGLN